MRTLFRIPQVIFYFFRYGLDGDIAIERLPLLLRPFAYLLPGRYLLSRDTRGQRMRNFFEALGPVFIKFGQLLSTRPDLIPADIYQSLTKLQDQVEPFSSEEAIAIIESSFKQDIDSLFQSFDKTPLASASIAQVHNAILPSGESVVVKIRRPKIASVIKRDTQTMRLLAKLAEFFIPEAKRFKPTKVVADYELIINNELNLQHEAANTNLLREQFLNSEYLYVPQIHWSHSNQQVMCCERIHGIPIGDIDALAEAGVDFEVLAKNAVKVFFTQLLENNFFHADMHPGNIFVDASKPQNPKFIAIDCAIMGSLEDRETLTLARLLKAIFERDYQQAAQVFIDSRWVDADTNVHELAGAIRANNEAIFSLPLEKLSAANQLMQLFATGRHFNMQVQPSFVLLQKTLFNIEGLGKQLYPDLNLWDTAHPYVDKWLKNHYSPVQVAKRIGKELPMIIDQLPEALHKLHQLQEPPTSKNDDNSRSSKHLAALGTLGLFIAYAVSPQSMQNVPMILWLSSAFMLGYLWFK